MSLRRIALAFQLSPARTSLVLGSLALSATVMMPSAQAQTSKGILTGVVRDGSGAIIPNAQVKIVGVSDGLTRTTTSNGDGAYRIEALNPETYVLTVDQPGFASFKASNIVVTPSQVVSYDVALTIGSNTQEIEVTANSSALDTDNGQITGIVNAQDLTKLPIFTVNPYELTTTVPGAQLVRNSGFSNGAGLQVNGARPRANNFLLDSQEINDVGIGGQAFQPQIPDSYESVAVLTSAASAEFGRAGGAVVNLVTKSGTNHIHGSVFERYTGSGLNAIGGQERIVPGYQKTRYNTHDIGFSAGGPIIRDKLFVFGGLAVTRYYGRATAAVLELPDANGYATLQRIGGPQVALLNQYLSNGNYLSTYTPVPRTTVTLNVGPQNGCPASGCIVTENYFQRPSPSQSNPDTQWTYRIDYKPWEKDSFYARYLHDRQSLNPDFFTNSGALVGFDTQQGGPSELGAGGWTHIFTSNLLNEFRVSETRIKFTFAPTAETLANPLYNLPTLSISGLPSLGPNQGYPQGRGEDLYQLQDTVGWTKGRQSLRIGFDIGRQIETDLNPLNAKGTLTFAGGGPYRTALGNFLQNQLGPSGTATRTFGNTRVDPHNWRSGGFVEDDIKFSPTLTMTFGLRYDYLTNPENSLQYPAIDPANPFGILTLNNGVVQANVLKVHTDTNNFAPRFGFAYTPTSGVFSGGKSVIRGGFGVFYDSPFSNFVTNAAASAPNAVAGTLTSTQGVGLTNASGQIANITPQLKLNSSVTSVLSNLVNPVTYQYNLGVEHQFAGNLFFAVRYVGTKGDKNYLNQQYNYFNGLTGQRLNPSYGAIVARGTFGSSNYNSLQVEGAHLFSHGFQIRGNYTYSKSMDNGSEIFTTDSSDTSYSANLAPGGRRQDYGPSAYDHRHYAVFTYLWSPKGAVAQNKAADFALNVLTRHWTISGISRLQSGTYSTFSVTGLDLNGDGSTANDRPIVTNRNAPLESAAIDGTFVGGTPGVYYDVASANSASGALVQVDPATKHFLIPYFPDNSYLNREIGRNSFSNPGLAQHDLALEKGVGIKEHVTALLRVEAQNVFNHNDVGILDTNTAVSIGTGDFLNRQNARQDNPNNPGYGRVLILWGKVIF